MRIIDYRDYRHRIQDTLTKSCKKSAASPDNSVCVIVQDVEEDNQILENVEKDGSNGQALGRLPENKNKHKFKMGTMVRGS